MDKLFLLKKRDHPSKWLFQKKNPIQEFNQYRTESTRFQSETQMIANEVTANLIIKALFLFCYI